MVFLCSLFCCSMVNIAYAEYGITSTSVGTSTKLQWKSMKKKPGHNRVYPGLPGPGSTLRVDRVLPGQLPCGFLLRLGLVSCPGRLGSRSTHRAGPGFKTMLGGDEWIDSPLSVGILMRVLWTVMYLIVPIEMLKISFFIPEK